MIVSQHQKNTFNKSVIKTYSDKKIVSRIDILSNITFIYLKLNNNNITILGISIFSFITFSMIKKIVSRIDILFHITYQIIIFIQF